MALVLQSDFQLGLVWRATNEEAEVAWAGLRLCAPAPPFLIVCDHLHPCCVTQMSNMTSCYDPLLPATCHLLAPCHPDVQYDLDDDGHVPSRSIRIYLKNGKLEEKLANRLTKVAQVATWVLDAQPHLGAQPQHATHCSLFQHCSCMPALQFIPSSDGSPPRVKYWHRREASLLVFRNEETFVTPQMFEGLMHTFEQCVALTIAQPQSLPLASPKLSSLCRRRPRRLRTRRHHHHPHGCQHLLPLSRTTDCGGDYAMMNDCSHH